MGPSKKISFLKGIALAAGATTLLSHFLPSSSPQPDPNAKVERDLSTIDFNHGLVVHDGSGYKTFFEKGGYISDKYPQWHPVPMSEEAMAKCPNSITLPAKEGAKLDVYSFQDGIILRDGQNFFKCYLYVGGGCSPGILLGAEEVKKTFNEFDSYYQDLQTQRAPDLSVPGAIAYRDENSLPNELMHTEDTVHDHWGEFASSITEEVKVELNERRLLKTYQAWVQANARPDGTIPPALASTNATLRSVLDSERKYEHDFAAIQNWRLDNIIGYDRGPNTFNCPYFAVMTKELFDRGGVPNSLCKGYLTKEGIELGHVFILAQSKDHHLYVVEATNRDDVAQVTRVAALNTDLIGVRTDDDRFYTIVNRPYFKENDVDTIGLLKEAVEMDKPSRTTEEDRNLLRRNGEQILGQVFNPNSPAIAASSLATIPTIGLRSEDLEGVSFPALRPDLPSVSRIDSNDYSDDQTQGR